MLRAKYYFDVPEMCLNLPDLHCDAHGIRFSETKKYYVPYGTYQLTCSVFYKYFVPSGTVVTSLSIN